MIHQYTTKLGKRRDGRDILMPKEWHQDGVVRAGDRYWIYAEDDYVVCSPMHVPGADAKTVRGHANDKGVTYPEITLPQQCSEAVGFEVGTAVSISVNDDGYIFVQKMVIPEVPW